MSLPKWYREGTPKHVYMEALSIAWEALHKIKGDHMLNCSSRLPRYCKPCKAREALKRIEALGDGK